MRIIIFILLFFSLQSQGQIIRANPLYRPFAVGSSCSYLLDQYSGAAAAYSLRKLDCDYAGSAIRVRRNNDNSEQDIGFTANGDLDTATLKTFIGSNYSYLTTWYDQSGNGRNAVQTSASLQPRVSLAAVIERKNNLPAIYFQGVYANRLVVSFTTVSQPLSSFAVASTDDYLSSTPSLIFDSYNNTAASFHYEANWGAYGDEKYKWYLGFGTALKSSHSPNNNLTLWSLISNSSSSYIYTNDSQTASGNSGTNGLNGLSIGNIRGNPNPIVGSYGFKGHISELVIWGSNQYSSISSINGNINTYYSIY